MQELILADAHFVVTRLYDYQRLFPTLQPHRLELNLNSSHGWGVHIRKLSLCVDPTQLLFIPQALKQCCHICELHLQGTVVSKISSLQQYMRLTDIIPDMLHAIPRHKHGNLAGRLHACLSLVFMGAASCLLHVSTLRSQPTYVR